MATVEQISERQNAAVVALENATTDVLALANEVKAAPRIANEAKTDAQTALTKATQAVTTAALALPKTGGNLSGPVYQNMKQADLENPEFAGSIAIYGVKDVTGANIGGTYVELSSDKIMTHLLARNRNSDGDLLSAFASLVMGSDGTRQFVIPMPKNGYDHSAVDLMFLKNYAAQNYSDPVGLHVGGLNASDTADLKNGRGLSESLPFASLMAALKYAAQNYAGCNAIIIQLHANAELTGALPRFNNVGYVKIDSDSTTRTLTIGDVTHSQGCFVVGKLNLVAQGGAANIFSVSAWASDATTLLFQGTSSFSGVVTDALVAASYGARVLVSAQLTGTITGKRFKLTSGSQLYIGNLGNNAIPGSIDGTADSSSQII